MMNRLLVCSLLILLLASCGGEEKKPEPVLEEFIQRNNAGRSFSPLHQESSRINEIAYIKTRKYAEKLLEGTIECEVNGDEADCQCNTESGKMRHFKLYQQDDNWYIDLNQPEFILEIFHIYYSQGMIKDVIQFATNTEKERLKVFAEMVKGMEIPNNEKYIVPFDIICKKFKKKYECSCISEEGETGYTLYKTSKGWKAEISSSRLFDNDTLIDYNSSEDFNLNQHDLDSLTDFSQKMLDSMLSM